MADLAVDSVPSTADMYAAGVTKPLEHTSTFNRSEELSFASASSGMMNSLVLSAAGCRCVCVHRLACGPAVVEWCDSTNLSCWQRLALVQVSWQLHCPHRPVASRRV